MLKRALFVAFLTALPCMSAAQVYQSGSVTAGNCANWAGTNLIADSGAPCNAAAGSSTQLQWNNSGALGGISGATSNGTLVQFAPNALSLSGSTSGSSLLNAPATGGGTAALPQGSGALAYTITGTNTYSIAASGGNFTSVNALLTFLSTQTIAPGATINAALACGQTFTSSAPIQILAKYGTYIQISGCAHLNNTVTSIVSSSGSAGAYSLVLQMGSSVSGITANNDYVNIHGASGGTNPNCLNGNFPVTATNAGSSQITVTLPSQCLPSGSVSATVEDLPSVLAFSGNSDGVDVWNGGDAIQLQDVEFIATSGTSTGAALSIQDVGRVYYNGDIGVYGFATGILELYNSEINGQNGSVLALSGQNSGSVVVNYGSTLDAPTLNVGGGTGIGVGVDMGASVLANVGGVSGMTSDGFRVADNGTLYIGGSGGNWYSVNNGGYGFNGQSQATINLQVGGTASGNTSGAFYMPLTLAIGSDTSSIGIGANALGTTTNTANGENTAIGQGAEQYLTSAQETTAIGYDACPGASGAPLTGNYNTCIGAYAGRMLQGSAHGNTAVGTAAAEYVSTSNNLTAFGDAACQGVSGTPLTGSNDSCFGTGAGAILQGAASNNTFNGINTGSETSTGSQNTYTGSQAGQGSVSALGTGNNNSAYGFQTLENIQGVGASNAAFGQGAAQYVSTGAGTSAFGNQACQGASGTLTTGSNNTCFGRNAGQNIQGAAASNLILGPAIAPTLHTGSTNIMLGVGSNCDVASNSTSNHFAVCAASGSTDLMDGTLTSGSLALTVNGALTLSPLSSAGLMVNNASGAVSSVATVTTATTPANFSATRYLSVNIGGTTYYIPANTTTW